MVSGSVRVRIALLCSAVILAGCGGGGGGGTGGNTGTLNTPPSFTSAATASVPENTSGTVYTAAATDAQGSPVTYSISGGADAAKFAITAAGALSFVSAPNFDLAGDADSDNVYQVTLAASDGSASSTLNLAVTVANSREGVQLRRVANGFTRPAAVSVIPGSTDIYVAEKGGGIYLVTPATGVRKLLVTVPVGTDGDRGITAIYASPDHATTGYFYVLYSATNGDVRLTRYRRNLGNDAVSLNLIDTVLGSHASNTNDYGGWIGAYGVNDIYVATGDAGGVGDPAGSAQSGSSLLGKLIRFDGNFDPYAGAGVSTLPMFTVVASGLHNPAAGDLVTGGIYLPDRAEGSRNELNLFPFPRPSGGWGNYGWPFKEGTQTVRAGAPAGLVDPVTEYARGSGTREGVSITGGINYRGSVTSLIGSFLMVDYAGKVFQVAANRLVAGATLAASNYEVRTLDFAPDAGTLDHPTSVTEDAAGNVYILDDDGEIFQLRADGS